MSNEPDVADPILRQFVTAYEANDLAGVSDILARHPTLVQRREFVNHWMEDAANKNNMDMAILLYNALNEPSVPEVDIAILQQFNASVAEQDLAKVRDLLTQHTELREETVLNQALRDAAETDNVELVALLVEFGADIHAPDGHGQPPAKEGVIVEAAEAGAINVVRWLLDRGAKMNFEYEEFPGESRCTPLTGAIHGGHFEVVKLLVERGANINSLWGDTTPLAYAIMYRKKEIEAYLRSKGAFEPSQLKGEQPLHETNPILEHIEKHFGKPQPLGLQEIVPGDPPIDIHVIPPLADRNNIALVTSGMSARPMTVPPGGENYQFAELIMYLPPDWPLTALALKEPEHAWPIEWLRRIAHYPHDYHTWLGGPTTVIANGEPPEPITPFTQLTCLFLVVEPEEFSHVRLPDGRTVVFYTVVPLYTEERDLEKAQGTPALLRLLAKYKMDMVVNIYRPNVVWAEEIKR
jgi:uncharacterized protein